MTSNEKLLKILNAIQEARKASVDPSIVNLYLTKADGLNDFDANEIWDILIKIEHDEKVLKIESVPKIVDIHAGTDTEKAIYNTQTYFSIKILNPFDKWLLKLLPSETPLKGLYFDDKTGKLTINSKTITLRRSTFKSGLVIALLSNKKKDWSWEEILGEIEHLEGEKVPLEFKEKFYPACDGLQKSISQKIGLNDFLIFTTSTVRINPKYL
jgi:hypothetical protein